LFPPTSGFRDIQEFGYVQEARNLGKPLGSVMTPVRTLRLAGFALMAIAGLIAAAFILRYAGFALLWWACTENGKWACP
jgi:hypothetical protein